MVIRPYQARDEIGWLRCRVLAFLETAYYDNVLNKKETYANPSIELVAEVNGKIVGLIDIELEERPGTVCSASSIRRNDLAYSGTSRLSGAKNWETALAGSRTNNEENEDF